MRACFETKNFRTKKRRILGASGNLFFFQKLLQVSYSVQLNKVETDAIARVAIPLFGRER